MAATRRGGRPDPRYVAAVSPARAIGTTYSNARPTPASRPSQTPPERRHFQRRFPGVADGRPRQQSDEDEAAAEHERRRRHGADWRTSRIGNASATTPAVSTAATTEGGGRGQALKQQPPRPDGVDHECHDEAPSPSGLPAAAGDRS